MNAQITVEASRLTERVVRGSVDEAVALIDAPEEAAANDRECAGTFEVLGVPSTSLTPIDMHALRKRCLGNLELVMRVLSKFRTSGIADLEQLEAAVAQSDFQTIARISHRFKGAAANVSAARLHIMATYLEQMAREQNVADLQDAIAQTRGEWEVFARFASDLVPCTGAAITCPGARTK